jgi:hypothetical protein
MIIGANVGVFGIGWGGGGGKFFGGVMGKILP